MSDWTGIGGFVVGCVGVALSAGSWIWAARASRAAGEARQSAVEAKESVESLQDRFDREATESAELQVFRSGGGVLLVNKSNHPMHQVRVGPADQTVSSLDKLVDVGELPAKQSAAADVVAEFPSWSSADEAIVFWLNGSHHRRVNIFPIRVVDPARLSTLASDGGL
jgi:hypothetical protein